MDNIVADNLSQGLLRFATEAFTMSESSLSNPFVHLTNYSINKNNSAFVHNDDADDDDRGHKWSLMALRRHLRQRGLNERAVFHDIYQVIIKTIVAIEDQVVHAIHQNVHVRDACFCLLGSVYWQLLLLLLLRFLFSFCFAFTFLFSQLLPQQKARCFCSLLFHISIESSSAGSIFFWMRR